MFKTYTTYTTYTTYYTKYSHLLGVDLYYSYTTLILPLD